MKRALVLASLLVAGTASAQTPLVVPPSGWRLDADQSNAAAAKANGLSHFGGSASLATAAVYVAGEPGVALFVTAIAAKVKTAREVAVRAEMDALSTTPKRAEPGENKVNVSSWGESIDQKNKVVDGELRWTDSSAKTKTISRMLIVADSENLVAVTGECLAGEAASPKLVDACEAALATLDPGIPVDKRVDVAPAPEGAVPPPKDYPAGSNSLPTMSDGTHTPLPPMTVTPTEKPAPDRRPVYVGLGIVLLAAVFWWNSRRRAKFEKDPDE